jgi:glutathione S-transferase
MKSYKPIDAKIEMFIPIFVISLSAFLVESLSLGRATSITMQSSKEKLFTVPVANHGARVTLITKAKGLDIDIINPMTLGGLKSEEYLKMNPQGKMPVIVTPEGFSIFESDCIARYLVDKYPNSPTFMPRTLNQRSLSNLICRIHDIYISPIQGCMYKAAGTPFSIYGTDRLSALQELRRQIKVIENTVVEYDEMFPNEMGPYLCGDEISLADASLFPTSIFFMTILPQVFKLDVKDFFGPRLLSWYEYMLRNNEAAKYVYDEMLPALEAWKASGKIVSMPLMYSL